MRHLLYELISIFMKIGILTYYGDLNCGTNLQAYATLMAVKEAYPNDFVEIIPFHGFKQKRLPYLSNCTPSSLAKDLRRISKYATFRKEHLGITTDYTTTSVEKALAFIKKRGYDIIYIGADTLLELSRLPADYDGLSAYWLSPEIKAKKIFLAASCKNLEYDSLSPKQKELMTATLKDFSAFGVRDVITQQLIEHFIPADKISYISDPTFSLKIDYSHIEKYLEKKKLNIPQNCICIHSYRDDNWCEEVAATLKKQGYTIASLRPKPWADFIFNDLSPLEQAGIFRYFRLTITHRFHEAIFSLKNSSPVLLYVNNKMDLKTSIGESKFSDLIKQFDLYPQCIIDTPNIDASCVLSQIPVAIDTVNSKKESIEKNIAQASEKYLNFIAESKKTILNE